MAPAGHKRVRSRQAGCPTQMVVADHRHRRGRRAASARPVEWDRRRPAAGGADAARAARPARRWHPASACWPGCAPIEGRPGLPQRYEGRTLKRLNDTPGRSAGRVPARTQSAGRSGGSCPPTAAQRREWLVPAGRGWRGRGRTTSSPPSRLPSSGYGLKPARVTERLGKHRRRPLGQPDRALHTHDIPIEFPAAPWWPPPMRARGVTVRVGEPILRGRAAGHHRRRGRSRLRRRGVRRARRRRVSPAGRDRRRGPLCAAPPPRSTVEARRRGNSCLLPRPRGADAAGGAVERMVQPEAGPGPGLPVRRDADRRRRHARFRTSSAAG